MESGNLVSCETGTQDPAPAPICQRSSDGEQSRRKGKRADSSPAVGTNDAPEGIVGEAPAL